MLDECNGHFGPPVPLDDYDDDDDDDDADGASDSGDGARPPKYAVRYHYHATGVTNLGGDSPHQPYYLGCQGPAKGRCDATVNASYDDGANWCGPGCGAELCVQPGTSRAALEAYIDSFTPGWLGNFTTNGF